MASFEYGGPENIDSKLATINKGRSARIIRSQTEDMLIDREDILIDNLVKKFRLDRLSNDEMRGKIGEIASLRWLRSELESTIRRGDAESEKEYSSG